MCRKRSDDQLSYICSSTYYQFSCNLDIVRIIHFENSVFLDTAQTLLLDHVHEA